MSDKDILDLAGQAAFVSGAGQGLGRVISLTLASHNLGGIAVNDFVVERAEAVADEIKALGVPAVAVPADVGDHEAVSFALETAEKALGPVTLLVNNAGNAGPTAHMGFAPEILDNDSRRLAALLPHKSAWRIELQPRPTPRYGGTEQRPDRHNRVGCRPRRRSQAGGLFGGQSGRRGVYARNRT